MKKIYERVFFELYLIIKKNNPDTAFYTALLMSALFSLNLLAGYGIIRYVFSFTFKLNRNTAIVMALIILFFNQVYFVASKRYKRIIHQYKGEGDTTIIGWIYIIITLGLFYFSSNLFH